MSNPDLILLHAPSIYDFRKKTILYGPVSDLVPPSPVFELYPIGFASMAEYLERAGFRVRIVNLAARMIKDENFDAEAMIKRLKAPLFGIDLHWMVHSQGAIEIARLVKKYHPDTNSGNKKFENKLKEITLAYTFLRNNQKNINYGNS